MYFKLRPSRRQTLEGGKEFTLVFRVPADWRGDFVQLTCRATGTLRSVMPALNESLTCGTRRFTIALYAAGDPGAQAAAEQLIRAFRPELSVDRRTREFRDLVLQAPVRSLAEAPVQSLLMNAAVDLMPAFAREMHGLNRPLFSPLVRGGTYGLASTIRWAFAGERYRKSG